VKSIEVTAELRALVDAFLLAVGTDHAYGVAIAHQAVLIQRRRAIDAARRQERRMGDQS
jgi:hypothetical protein